MITEYFLGVWDFIVGWFLGLFGTADGSGVVTITANVSNFFGPIGAALDGLGAWMPWSFLGFTVTTTLTLWLVSLAARVVKSFLPTMSG